jgi:hypothetical protein
MNDHTNSGIVFRDGAKKDQRDRDYRGECTVGGKEYWISAWIKEGRKGKFLSLSFKPKEAPKPQMTGASIASTQSGTPSASPVPGRSAEVVPDDIPFRSTIYRDTEQCRLNRRVL